MKRSDAFAVGLLLAVVLVVISCGNPETEFKTAEEANNEQAYAAFIRKFPSSPQTEEAKTRMVALS